MQPVSALPLPAKRALRKLGQDIRDARKRRRLPMELLAERARISRSTLTKVEKGDESVALGIYAAVLLASSMASAILPIPLPIQLVGPSKNATCLNAFVSPKCSH
jgi:transcriptional regulator with XRE-family HTH domain